MNPRKNTVNDSTDVRDPVQTSVGERTDGRGRASRQIPAWVRRWGRRLGWRFERGELASRKSEVLDESSKTASVPNTDAPASDVTQSSPKPARPVASAAGSSGELGVLSLLQRYLGRNLAQFLASLAFYTLLPIPFPQRHEFHRIARFAPVVGLGLGLCLGIADWGLGALGMPLVLRTAIVVVSWVGLTGGLHLDGAMDSADGLAVMDPKRRLAVMKDSVTGAFGVMVAIALLLLKFAALMALPLDPVSRTVALMAAMGWGRWGQVLAIDRYVYLRVEGKGAFHKRQLRSPDDLWPGVIALLGLSALFIWLFPFRWILAVGMVMGGFAIAFGTGAWFDRQLGGHTGDTYGAVVEWTEALLLCLLTLL